jgi:hypothetical protein
MDPRFILSAMAGMFCVVLIFAAVTGVRYVSKPVAPSFLLVHK